MKLHKTKEQCFKDSGLPARFQHAFYRGWYAAGYEINNGEDSYRLQERLYAQDFLERDDSDDE